MNVKPANQSSARPAGGPESERLLEDASRRKNWKRWGPYLAEREWGTVREDYSATGECWTYLPHDHARSRAYRWGEDGLLGITDRECRLCFALALWNGHDPILKERLFGLSGLEGNHGEDVKEEYFYLDSTPTHSYLRALYKYPQAEFPYARLVAENHRRSRREPEFELADTGVFAGNRYFDVFAEYAKHTPNDILVRLTVANRGPDAATLHLLPTVWFRNTWIWGSAHSICSMTPGIAIDRADRLVLDHKTLKRYFFEIGPDPAGNQPAVLFTNNETNFTRLFGVPNLTRYVKDAFHEFVVNGRADAVNPASTGTKAAPHYVLRLKPGESQTVRLRLYAADEPPPRSGVDAFEEVFAWRRREADEFYSGNSASKLTDAERNIVRQGYAGLLWGKQFYNYVVADWLDGDPRMPRPPESRKTGRNHNWTQLYSRDVLSMPDKWDTRGSPRGTSPFT